MSKKNKGGKTPSAKAERNLEALKKAKEAAIAAETKETKVENSAFPCFIAIAIIIVTIPSNAVRSICTTFLPVPVPLDYYIFQ